MLRRCIAATAFACAAVCCGSVVAQAYPAKPVRLVVPFPAGGPNDILGRLLAGRLSEMWAQQVIVDNRPGAGANIGTEIVAKAAPDGYTLLLTGSAIAIAPSIYPNLAYDPLKDFAPVTNVASSAAILVVHPSVPAKSVRELVLLAKAQPGKINYASPGTGTPLHLAAALFGTMAGINIVHIPYKGAAPALVDVIGGQVSMMIAPLFPTFSDVKAQKIRALGVTSVKRSPIAPDVPTIAEIIPGYEANFWYGMFGPAKIPGAIITKLNNDIVNALAFGEVRERIALLGIEAVGSTVEQFTAELKSDVPKWAKVVKASGARVE